MILRKARPLRILLSCLQSDLRHPIPAYDFWRGYFINGCAEVGWECLEVPGVDWVEVLTCPTAEKRDAWRAEVWDTVERFVRDEQTAGRPIDLFLSYLYPTQVEPTAIKQLQRLGVPCVNFFCDNVREFHEVPPEYGPFTLHWVPEFEALQMYRRAALPYIHAPMPCWIPPRYREVPTRESEPMTFIGSCDVLRRHLLGRASELGGDFVVRGPGWVNHSNATKTESASRHSVWTKCAHQAQAVRAHGLGAIFNKLANRLRPLKSHEIAYAKILAAVYGSDYFRVTREAKVTIGVNRVPTARARHRNPLSYSRLRDIEAPMLGACYLTEWTAGLPGLYDLDRDIDTYRSPEELVAKLDALNRDPVRRRMLRARAQKRALGEHSVGRTLSRIAQALGAIASHEN